MTLSTFNRWILPWISLGAGAVTVLVLRRGLSFAPLAVLLLLLAWVLAVVRSRFVSRFAGADSPVMRWLGLGLRAATTGLYQNVLFFLVPIWVSSASLPTINMLFPALLSLMALLSCFEEAYLHWVIERPSVRTVWSAVVLFATLVPACPVLFAAPMRLFVILSAFLSTGLAMAITRAPLGRQLGRMAAGTLGAALLAGALAAVVAPLLPPVPVQLVDCGTGTDVQGRDLPARTTVFCPGDKVFAWFAVAAPERYRQEVRFEWYREGEPVGRPFVTTVVGGREQGFRTWSYASRVWPGAWRVDLRADSGQLIGRTRFTVKNKPSEAEAGSGLGTVK